MKKTYGNVIPRDNNGFGLKTRGVKRGEIETEVMKAARISAIGIPARPRALATVGRPAPTRRHRTRPGA